MSEDTIIKPNGDKINRTDIVNESQMYYKEAYQNNLTDICDFSEGSEINTLHNSIAIEIFSLYKEAYRQSKQKYVKYATGTYLDELACEFHLTRKKSEVAKGTVTFTSSETIQGGYVIPAGTVILGRGTGYEYILQENVTITTANKPENGQVYSKLTGAKYNALPDTLTAFQNIANIRSSIKVTNPTEIIDGVDAETDEEFRERILNVKKERSYGTISSYSNLILNEVPDVHDVQFVDPEVIKVCASCPKHYKSNSTEICTDCTNVIYVNAFSKPCPDHVIDEVEYLMSQQNNLVIGQEFHLEKATLLPLYMSIHLYVTSIIDEDILADHIESFLNGDEITTKSGTINYTGINIHETLYKNRLIDVIEDIPGVSQVESIHLTKFNTNLPTSVQKWIKNGNDGYTYIDSNNYVYTRRSDEETSIDYWGEKNFDYISVPSGKVLSLGQKKSVDSDSTEIFKLTQTVVN